MTYIITQPFTRVNEEWVDNNINCTPPVLAYRHPVIQDEPNSSSTRFQANFYRHIGLDIVTETAYNYPYPYVSEKLLRPIACKRLFVVVGAPGTLELLHSKGFVTWADILDESYDLIKDPNKRLYQLQKTIQEFVLQPLDSIIDLVKSKSDTLEHNFKTLKNLQESELKQINDSY
jgi:hypothetical protein